MGETRCFPDPILIPPLIFKLDFLPYFGLYSQAETTSVTTKTRTKILGGIFEKFLLSNLYHVLIRSSHNLKNILKSYGSFGSSSFDTSLLSRQVRQVDPDASSQDSKKSRIKNYATGKGKIDVKVN